jgi:iron-sulfur cluster repair protein YtfE (RIC family)
MRAADLSRMIPPALAENPDATSPAPDASDDLHLRTALPDAYAWLERDYPRSDWPVLQLHAAARFWLERHDWFRGAHARLIQTEAQLRDDDPRRYARAVLPVLGGFLQHLDGHHRIESEHYFPAMSVQEPRMAAGFALLDRDHDAIHRLLEELAGAAVALNRALGSGADGAAPADRLAAVIATAAAPLRRHLHDEEDIVVPMLTRYGDPFELAAGRTP